MLVNATEMFRTSTTAPNQFWQTAFICLKVIDQAGSTC
jgi:hypothetical protein